MSVSSDVIMQLQLSTSSELDELIELDEQFASGPQKKGNTQLVFMSSW